MKTPEQVRAELTVAAGRAKARGDARHAQVDAEIAELRARLTQLERKLDAHQQDESRHTGRMD